MHHVTTSSVLDVPFENVDRFHFLEWEPIELIKPQNEWREPAKLPEWQLMFLQTTDAFTYVGVVSGSRWHFYSPCHIMFTLNVNERTFI